MRIYIGLMDSAFKLKAITEAHAKECQVSPFTFMAVCWNAWKGHGWEEMARLKQWGAKQKAIEDALNF